MLEIRNIRKAFGDLTVLNGLDLQVKQGEVVSILGPSGSGKTTLLRCVNFLERADEGTMTFDGTTYQMDRASKKEIIVYLWPSKRRFIKRVARSMRQRRLKK